MPKSPPTPVEKPDKPKPEHPPHPAHPEQGQGPKLMTRAQLLAEINSRLATLAGQIATRQAAYFAAHGRYWQGLCTHATAPGDGTEAAADREGTRPTDEAESWTDAGLTPDRLFALQCDTYEGPTGPGYVLTVTVTWSGRTWQRAQGYGPETHRTFAWRQLPEPA